MNPMSTLPVIVSALSTIDLGQEELFEYNCKSLLEFFNIKDLAVSYFDSKSQKTEETMLSRVSDGNLLEKASRYRKEGVHGVITLSDIDGKLFYAMYDWKNYYQKDMERLLKQGVIAQNTISLHLEANSVVEEEQRGMLIDYCMKIAVKYDANYVRVFHAKNDKDILGESPVNLSGGLQDIYWLNIMGKPFIDIISKERLLSSPAWRVQFMEMANKIIIQSTDRFCDHRVPGCAVKLKAIRSHIGEQYFYKQDDRIAESSGVISIADFVRQIYRAKRRHDNVANRADVCPVFDWNHMLIKRDT